MDILIRMLMAVLKDRKHKKQRRVLSTVLAAVVVFMTTYSLILPAITLEESTAETTDGIFLESADVSEADPADDDVDPSGELLLTDDAREESAPASDGWEDGLIEDADWEENGELADIPDEPALTDTGDETEEAAETETGNVYAETEEATEDTTESEESVGEGETESELEEQYPEVEFSDSTQYTQVKVYAPEGAFPEGTQMLLSDVEDDETIAAICDAALAENSLVQKVHAVDISFRNSRNEEIEPLLPIRVEMTAEKCAEVGSSSVSSSVVHVDDSGNATIVENAQKVEAEAEDEKDADKLEDVETIAFEAKEFSVYALVYTVDFHWEVDGQMYEFSLPGGGFISFSDLIEVLGVAKTGENDDVYLPGEVPGINDQDATGENGSAALTLDGVVVSEKTREFVADVKSVVFSSPELVDVSKVESETTVGGIKESRGLDVQYSAELTEEQIAEINAQTVVAGDWALISVQPFESTESLTVTMKTGEVFEIRVTDAQLKKTVKTASGETWEITITYDDSAEIPKDAELRVEEILPEDERYEQYYQQSLEKISVGEVPDTIEDESGSEMIDETAETASEEAATTTSYAHIFDIQIWAGDQQIEPASGSTVSVSIKLLDAPENEDTNLQVVHFGKDGLEVMELAENNDETKAGGTELNFVTDEFSVYAIVGTEIQKEITLTSPDGENVTYVVSVTYGPEAQIPEGAILDVNVIDESTATYKDVKDILFSNSNEDIDFENSELVLNDESGEVSVYNYSTPEGIVKELASHRCLDVLDISILDKDGEAVEPQATVQVSIIMKNIPADMTLQDVASSAVVQHLNEESGSVVVETVAAGDESVKGSVKTVGNKVEAAFEVDSFSLYTFTYKSYVSSVSARVHYVDESGRELPAPTVTPSQNSGQSHLVYDIDGYEFVKTTISSASGTQISPYIQAQWVNYNLRWRYRTLTINGDNRSLGNWQNLTQDVYVVYRQKTNPPQGGESVPTVPQGEWPEFPNGDKTKPTKTSVDNGDGTNTLSLTVTGAETPLTSGKVKAQVIVVFDISGSMNYRMGSDTNPNPRYGEHSRLYYSKEAVESLTNSLGTNDKLDVEMALVTFSTYAQTEIGFTNVSNATNRQNFIDSVNDLSAFGGTNWEAALREANYLQTKSDAKTYVIFVSDGAPTYRVGRGNITENNIQGNVQDREDEYIAYMAYGIYGNGSDTHAEDRSFALTQATSIVNSKKTFYTVALTDENDTGHASEYMEDLNTRAGGAGNYSATSPQELADVINAIGTSITTELGFADISIHDGITELTNLNAKVLQSVDENSFKYYRYGGENNKYGTESNPTTWGNDPSDSSKLEGGANKATYDSNTGAVEWNMGSGFQLEDGVTYKVSFKVWPDQDAYDWIAKLRNGTVQYADLPADVKAQIDEATLSLKTNTDAYVRYKKSSTTSGDTTTTGDPIQVDYNTVDPMPLPAQSIPIEKIFINELDPERYENEPVRISLTGDGDTFAVVNLNDSNDFKTSAFISYGLMTPGDEPVLKEPGHDFVLTELSAYHWDLEAGVYRPMIIGGERKLLQKVASGGDYTIDGKQYKELADGASISATNYRRSNLNLTKNIVDKDGQTSINDKYPNQLFEYTITVNSADGEDVYFSVQTDPDDYTTVVTDLTTSAFPELDDDGNPKNNGYFYQHSGASFTVSLKPTWNLRLTNMPKGTTYTIVESSSEGFEFNRASLNPAGDDEQFTVTESTATVTGVVAEYSKQYQITYTNRSTMLDIVVIKTDDAGTSIPGATFNLLKKDGSSYHAIPNRDDLANFSIPVNGITLTGLLPGDYELEEVSPPDGYIIIKKETYFNLSNSDEVIKLSDESKDIASTSGEKKDTVSIKNQPGQALPNTGGPGTIPYTLGGIALIMASALMYGFRMRRRERRLN